MSLVNLRNMYTHAYQEKYLIGAYNVFNSDTLEAVLQAAESEQSPVIIQVSMGCRRYHPNFRLFVDTVKMFAEAASVPVGMNHDHCPSVSAAKEAIDLGIPSVMFDGSALPYEENIACTSEVVRYGHVRGCFVEAELGRIPGFEDEVFASNYAYTSPKLAADFISRTSCDSLAVSVGTSHGGVLADAPLELHFDLLNEIMNTVPEGYPLVLHGAASVPEELILRINVEGAEVPQMRNCKEEDIARSALFGVRKANMDVDNYLAYGAAIRNSLNQERIKYDPRNYLKSAREAFTEEVRHKIRYVSHSSQKNWLKEMTK